MMKYGNRTVTVKKTDLIATLKENREKHIADFEKAIVAYKSEAYAQLQDLLAKANNNERNLTLNLIEPVDRRETYDKAIKMFEWEVADEVNLTQDEFKDYVLDEADVLIKARLSNSSYIKLK